uniref:Uncharacterized protein n=1 Tax=Megaselia scalaris TaxID=36166 RepID=T1GTE4_MEGSC
MDDNAAAKNIYARVEEVKRRGRQRAIWIELVEKDAKEIRIPSWKSTFRNCCSYSANFALRMFANKMYYLIFLLMTYVIFSDEVQKSCSDFKNNTDFLCDDSDLFPILIYGKSFNDPKRIEFKWMNQSLVIECKKYDQTVKEFNISFENVSELKITNCFIRLHNIFKFFPNLIESKKLGSQLLPGANMEDFPIIFSSKHLGVYHFKNIENLEELSFSGMPIQNLTLDNNSLKILDLSSGSFESFPDIVFKNNSTLTSLIFQFNNIHIVENLFGYDFNNIEKLDLKGNYITNLPVLAFPKLKYLDLNLCCNKLEHLPRKLFSSLKKLIVLDLSENQISSFHDYIFQPLENIRRINLSKNKLKTFNYKAFLEGVYSMARDLQFQDIKLNIDLELPSYDELTTGSLDLRDNDNYLLDTFNPTKLNNELNTSKTKKSWIFNINVLNKTECYCHLYDIYLLLTLKQSFENLKFVELSVMCDIPTKNYLDEYSEKDFQSMTNPRTCPGNCIESVSRLDCSNSGMTTIPEINERNIKELDLRNNKLMLEFRTACASSLKEKRPRLIVILCQEIEELDQLDSEIKAYFNSNTYLSWNDKLFWSRLKYALPHRKGEHKYNDIELEEI